MVEWGQDFIEKPAGGDLSWRCCDVCFPGPPLVRVKASVSVRGAARDAGSGLPLPLQLFPQPWLGPAPRKNAAGLPVHALAARKTKGVEDWEGLLAEWHLASAARRSPGHACSHPACRGANDLTPVYGSGPAFSVIFHKFFSFKAVRNT